MSVHIHTRNDSCDYISGATPVAADPVNHDHLEILILVVDEVGYLSLIEVYSCHNDMFRSLLCQSHAHLP